MCRAVKCRECGLQSWSGCGQHVTQVMAGVPNAQRCPGHAKSTDGSFLGRLFRRG